MQSNKESKTSKKIVYVTTVRLPTEKAHGLSTVKICEAFSLCGYEVDLVIPKLWRRDHRDVYDFYNVKRNFNIIRVPCIDLIPLKVFDKITFLIQSFSFSSLLLVFIFLNTGKREKVLFFFLMTTCLFISQLFCRSRFFMTYIIFLGKTSCTTG